MDYMPQLNVFIHTWMTPIAATDVKMYCIPSKHLKEFSNNHQARDAWMALLIATLAIIAERPYHNDIDPFAFVEDEENTVHISKRSSLFDPLAASEEPNPLLAGSTHVLERPFKHLWESCKLSVFVPWPMGSWPVGMRHVLPPPTDPKAASAIMRRTEDIQLRSGNMNPTEESPSESSSNGSVGSSGFQFTNTLSREYGRKLSEEQ
jgi:hypothetical protein